MKYFISVDIEGSAGALNWNYANKGNAEYEKQKELLTDEVLAVVEGIQAADPEAEIVIKDAHDYGDNLNISRLPEEVTLIMGWDGSPMSMMQGLDESFDGVFLIGYHSEAGSGFTPLSHTMNARKFRRIKLNGEVISEFTISYLTAMREEVPVLFVSGDEDLCKQVKDVNETIETVWVFKGAGDSIITKTPKKGNKELREIAEKAVRNKKASLTSLPEEYELEIEYNSPQEAFKNSHYPKGELISTHKVKYSFESLEEVLTAFLFL